MKVSRIKSLMLIATAAAALFAGSAQASDSVSVTVNATVAGMCKFFTSSPVVNIKNTGTNIDPSSGTNATGNAAITYRCSNGTGPTFTVPATATVTASGGATMTPDITSANTGAGTGMGSGQDKTLTVTGTITSANFQNAAAGDYTGSITVSVSP